MRPASAYEWSVRVVGRAEHASAQAFVRTRQFDVDSALSFDAAYPAVTALEYVLGAVGGDLAAGLRDAARRRRFALDGLECVVTAELENALAHLGVIGEAGTPAIARLRVRVYASAPEAPPGQLLEAWREALARSPLAHTFARLARFEPELTEV